MNEPQEFDFNQLFDDLNRLVTHPITRQVLYHFVQEQKIRFSQELKELDCFPLFEEECIMPINYNELVPPDTPGKVKEYFNFILSSDWLRTLVLDKFYDCYLPLYEEKLTTTAM